MTTAPDFEKVELAGGRAVLYRGDCRELLAAGLLKNDAIVSDPPYGIGFQHSGKGHGGVINTVKAERNLGPIFGDDEHFNPLPWISIAPVDGTGQPRIVLWGADHFRTRLPCYGTLLAWDKHLGQAGDDSFCDCEWAWVGKKVKREVFRYLWKGVVCKINAEDISPTKGGKGHGATRFARVHVSQKPVALMRWCIQKLKPPPGCVILDPYMGSGTTGIAALSLGMKFTGVEIDSAHFETSRARIEAWWAEHGHGEASP